MVFTIKNLLVDLNLEFVIFEKYVNFNEQYIISEMKFIMKFDTVEAVKN